MNRGKIQDTIKLKMGKNSFILPYYSYLLYARKIAMFLLQFLFEKAKSSSTADKNKMELFNRL